MIFYNFYRQFVHSIYILVRVMWTFCWILYKQVKARKSLEVRNAPQMHVVYKRQKLLSNTTCTPRHDKENHILWKELRRHNSRKMLDRIMVLVFCTSSHYSYVCIISIPFVPSKIWPGQASILKQEYPYVTKYGRIVVLEYSKKANVYCQSE